MKSKTILCLLLVLIFNPLFAQKKEGDFFSKDLKVFKDQFKDYMSLSARDDNKEAVSLLDANFTVGNFNKAEQEKVIDMLNLFQERRTPNYPYYKDYVTCIVLLKKKYSSEDFFNNWHSIFINIVKNQKRGENIEYHKFMNFSMDFFSKNALNSEKAKTWMLDHTDLELKEINGQPYLKINEGTLIGYTREDTIRILNTSGTYYPMTKQWIGKKGKVTWERAGIQESVAYALMNEYKIDMDRVGYSVDSVRLSYKEYFPQTVWGKLDDRLVPENDIKKSQYPKFISYKKDYELKNVIAENVVYKGDFNLIGSRVFARATDTSDVELEFYLKDKVTKALIARGNEISVNKGVRVTIDKAKTILLYKKDSIIHPSLSVSFDIKKNEMKLIRGETGIDRARFYTTYHKMEFEADVVKWNFNEDSITFKMLSGAGKSAATFISEGNFDKSTYNLARGATTYDPLTEISKAIQEYGSQEVPLSYLAAKLDKSLKEEQALSLIFLLIENGFVNYNPNTKMVSVKDKTIKYYLLANTKRIDYDILKLKSFGKKRNATLDLKNFNLILEDCRMIPFNDSSEVVAYPKNDSDVVIQKNRDMVFDAKILCGRMDMYGDKFKFNYDSFNIIATKLDTMKINIPDGDKLDGEGRELLRPLMSKIENIKGKIEINNPINKSGRIPLFYYPRLTTTAPSYVYYDMPNNNGGIYKRDKFFFEIKPFVQDSLLRFDPKNIFYDGKLVTAKVFPDISQRLTVQEDFSLGFKHVTPADGLPVFQGRGTFSGDLALNNLGLNGKGMLKYLTTTIFTDSVIFFPERSLMIAKDLTMKEQKEKGKVEFPEVEVKKARIDWRPYSDSMLIFSTDTNSFKMYRGITSMNGSLMLSSKGLLGTGSLDWSEASVSSNLMKFKAHVMDADTASLLIKTLDGDKVTFKTPNVKAKIDFIDRIGDFKSNTLQISTDFAYNQYKAYLNQFKWDIDAKILDFSAPKGSDGAIFQSMHPNQDSLMFKAMKGKYNLVTSIIDCEGVEEIRVADCKVIPDKGKVKILPEAKMETLKNAKIKGDTLHYWHTFENVTADIYGKNDMTAFGEYNVKVYGKTQMIKIPSIKVNHTEEKISRKVTNHHYTVEGRGAITIDHNLEVYPHVFFNGEVSVFSNKELLNYKGAARIKFIKPARVTDWFDIDNDLDPNNLYLIKDTVLNDEQLPLYSGILIDKVSLNGIYTSILEGKQTPTDESILDAKGVIMHDKKKNRYFFGDSLKIAGASLKGNMIEYNDTAGKVRAEGKMNFNFNLGGLPLVSAGYMLNDMNLKTYNFNLSLAMKFMFEKNIMNLLTNSLMTEIMDNKDITYDNENQKKQFSELLEKKDLERALTELGSTSVVQNKPKRFNYNLMFQNLNMEFVELDMAYRSKGDLNLVFLGDKMINKTVKGYLEFGHRGSLDFFNLYITTPNKEWYYMTFRNGTLQVSSSIDEINASLAGVDQKKRIIKKNDLEYYMYMNGDPADAKEFNERMKKGGMFEQEEKRDNFSEDSVYIDPELLKTLPSQDNFELDSAGNQIPKKPIYILKDEVKPKKGKAEDEIIEENPDEPKDEKKKKKKKKEDTPTEEVAPSTSEPKLPEAVEKFEEEKKKEKKKKKKEEVSTEEIAPPSSDSTSMPVQDTEPKGVNIKEAEKKAKEEAAAKAKAEKEEAKKAKEEADVKAKAEKEEAAAKAKAEKDAEGSKSIEDKEAEKKAKEEAAAKAKAEKEAASSKSAEEKEAEKKAKEEAIEKAKADKANAEIKAKAEKEEAIEKAKAEKEAAAQRAAEEKEAIKKAKEEAAKKAVEEKEVAKKEKEEADAKAKAEKDAEKEAKKKKDTPPGDSTLPK